MLTRSDELFVDEFKTTHDLDFLKYLIIRVGHTTDTILPLPRSVSIKNHKKERKITLYGQNKSEIQNIAYFIYNLRRPSPYTGRGVKFKHIKIRYKKVRKTKAGGRAF